MIPTSNLPSSETRRLVSTLGKQLKSSATALLSDLRQTASGISSALSSETDPLVVSKLSALLKQTRETLDNCQIEQMLARASEKQTSAFGALYSGQFSTIALMGGNQSGKTYCASRMVAKQIRDDLCPDAIVWCISPNNELSIKKQQKELWDCLPHSKISGVWNPKSGFGVHNPIFIYDERTTENPNGRNIIVYFKTQAQYSNDPDSYESETVTGLVWIDESVEEFLWNAIQPRIAIHNVPVIVSTIPRMDWMLDALEEAPPEARVYFDKLLPMDNPAMTQDGYDRLASSIQSDEEKQMRLFGNFMSFGGIIYKEFRKEYKPKGHIVRPFEIPADWPRWRMMDVGMDHPTVCLWGTVAPNGNKYIYREYRSRHTPILKDAGVILAWSEGETFQGSVIIDPAAYQISKANERSVAQQFADAGLPCRPGVRVGSGIKEWPLIQMVKRCLLNDALFVFDTCEGLIGEFRKWKFKRNVMGEPVGDDFEDKNNDGLDALKLWVATNPQHAVAVFEVESTIE